MHSSDKQCRGVVGIAVCLAMPTQCVYQCLRWLHEATVSACLPACVYPAQGVCARLRKCPTAELAANGVVLCDYGRAALSAAETCNKDRIAWFACTPLSILETFS